MDILKSSSKPVGIPKRQNPGRRSFIWKMGAAMSAVLASAAPGKSSSGTDRDAELKNRVDQLASQLEILEDEKAIRRLHLTYENLLNNRRYDEVENLFADDGEVIFNGGIFKSKAGGIRRLFQQRFKSGLTGRRIEPAPGFQPDIELQQDVIKVAADRNSAGARFSYSIQVGIPMHSDSQLVKMARLHGEGILKWWEGGTYEASYVRCIGDGGWKIERLKYRALSKTDYRSGKRHARPISVPLFSRVYPEDPAGPDMLAASDPK